MNDRAAPLLPWSVAPCRCVVTHVPKPVMTELHHIHPMGEQKRIWGEVRDHERVSLCSSGHENVHSMLTKILAGQPPGPAAGNEYLRWAAEEGARRVRAAEVVPE